MLKVLVGCECSGSVRRAFRTLGHDAWSCDLKPATDGSPHHIQADVLTVLGDRWDIGIFHPNCTFLTVSAEWAYKDADFIRYPDVGYHMNLKPGTLTGAARRKARSDAVDFIIRLIACPIRRKAIENPIGHLSTAWRKPNQTIQPYQFGDDASKATSLWLEGLPPLIPTKRIPGRKVEWPKGSGKIVERWSNQTDGGQNKLPPSETRAAERAVTYQGIAAAMAEQWGK